LYLQNLRKMADITAMYLIKQVTQVRRSSEPFLAVGAMKDMPYCHVGKTIHEHHGLDLFAHGRPATPHL